jgi:DNA polymerase III epsilon subunit family exonuclease
MGYFKNIVVFDFETGGTNSEKHAITEIALVTVNSATLEIGEKFSCLFKPYGKEYTEEAEKITGITQEMLENEGLEFNDAFDKILDFLDNQAIDGVKPIFSGHNIDKFDMPFMQGMFDENKRKIERSINMDTTLDTLKMSRIAFEDAAVHTLAAACANVGIIFEDAHRALNDTTANAKMLIELLKRLRGGGGSSNGIEKPRNSYQF